jgi:hypothetical protein
MALPNGGKPQRLCPDQGYDKPIWHETVVSRAWHGFKIMFRYDSSYDEVVVENPHDVAWRISSVELADALLAGGDVHIPLADDSRTHHVCVIIGSEIPRARRRA